ncbi:MAG: hypothetical protein JNK85_09760 [Verrucomicrobiales bacterium]|nr:hypothetical protein [Verrucomicrobiales bacterium]
MKPHILKVSSLLLLSSAVPLHADVLELKNGSVINGKYVGGSTATVRFETSAGVQVLPTSDIIALTFTSPPAPAATAAPTPPPAPAAAPTPTPSPTAAAAAPAATAPMTLPAGTMLLVRMMDSVSSRSRPGSTFTTKLEYNLVVDGRVAIKAGTVIYGKVMQSEQAGRAFGRSVLDIRLSSIAPSGTPIPISTSNYAEAGAASIKKAAGGAAMGAAIGAIAGDAGTGAAIGATASLLKRGQTVTIPPGTLLEFNLSQPLTVHP